jgi:hypothetical protein
VRAISSFRELRTTMGGVNLVAGFRPELWSEAAPDDAPAGVEGFNEDVIGIDGFVMPATQRDAVLWLGAEMKCGREFAASTSAHGAFLVQVKRRCS